MTPARPALRISGGSGLKEHDWRYLLAGLILLDLFSVLAASVTAAWLASQPVLGLRASQDYRTFVPLTLVVFALIAFSQGLYDPQNLLGGTREYAAVLRACTYGLVALILVGFTVRRYVSREWLVFCWALAASLVGIERFVVRRIAYRLRRRGHFTSRAIVVGADADSVALAQQLGQPGSGIHVVGFLDDYVPAGSIVAGGLKVLGAPAALMRVAAATGAGEAILVPQALPWETLQRLMAEAVAASNTLRVHLSAGFYDLLTTSVRLSERNHVPLLTINKVALTPFETAFKTTLDYALATTLLIVFAPPVALTALWLRFHGAGKLFERRRVLGRRGKPFDLLSFRSSDPFGSEFIRKFPGLLNVLAGQLSLVGPRPASSAGAHSGTTPLALLAIRPGLTGPWRQVDDPDEQSLLDLYYIRNYSIWLDLQVLRTRFLSRLHSIIPARWAASEKNSMTKRPVSKERDETIPPAVRETGAAVQDRTSR